LLGKKSLSSVAVWADSVRNDPEYAHTYNWHFVDIPKSADTFDDARDCFLPKDKHPGANDDHQNCVVDRIVFFQKVLGDTNAARADRVEALKFLVHFVGDVHQPFHAVGDFKGANLVQISEFGDSDCPFAGKSHPCNLHSAWDDGLIEHTGMTQAEYVAHLEDLITEKNMAAGTGDPVKWANESHAAAKDAWLEQDDDLTEAYYKEQIKVVDERLALAGLRLAALLNNTFKNKSPQDFR
jgi:hypothetical protein